MSHQLVHVILKATEDPDHHVDLHDLLPDDLLVIDLPANDHRGIGRHETDHDLLVTEKDLHVTVIVHHGKSLQGKSLQEFPVLHVKDPDLHAINSPEKYNLHMSVIVLGIDHLARDHVTNPLETIGPRAAVLHGPAAVILVAVWTVHSVDPVDDLG